MSVQRHGRRGLQLLPIDRAQNPHVVIGARGGADDAVVGIDHLHELADDEGDGLDPLDLLLGAEELALEVLVLVLDVLLLDLDELELALEGFEAAVEVVVVGGGVGGGRRVREGKGGWWVQNHCCGHLWWCLVAVDLYAEAGR